ncbi:unnamed protein product [Danaus chrysippus]|uniref:DNA-directed DNA polymerase n=1 Tax=Danaus chrysippus TaxID=151541 RepID=A0A8J2QFC6_9NEOP|nr:unnamed protein product [Danaus chrysippus]
MKCNTDEIDLQKLKENVSFLADVFENTFSLQSTINYVKDYVSEIQSKPATGSKRTASQINKICSQSLRNNLNLSLSNKHVLSQLTDNNKSFTKKLKNWGLPSEICRKYEEKGIVEMFDWQVECLSNPKVLIDCQNLLYSAPTSAGKTLVAELLTIKTVLERQKKVIIILPFVSIVREKMFYLQDILSSSGIRVEGFMGSQSPPGGLQAVHIAICTIEKANSLINKLLDEGNISELGAVVVDELHLLGDPHRGYILELLLTKIKYTVSKLNDLSIQIIGMSATLPNLKMLADWLEAHLFITEFRPIPLIESCLIGDKYYNKKGEHIGMLCKSNLKEIDDDSVLLICLETIKSSCSVLIFCMTKNRCENLAQSIASSFFKLGCMNNEQGMILREQLKTSSILEVLEQLKGCPVGLDPVLKNIISFGVAYHHAGLTFDERDIIEGAFKSGAVRVLVATSTLSSGVNLPARKVIIRCPVFQKQPINILTYKQMIGRAGRMGKDTKGESILICTSNEQKIGFDLMMGDLDPVKSCIETEDKFMRAVLEMIASQDVCTEEQLDLYSKSTLLFSQQSLHPSQNFLLNDTLKELINYELVRIQKDGEEIRYVATSLGKACLSSSMSPNDGLSLFCELQKARQCLVLETDLHLIYLVTPYSVSNQWNNIDWLHLLTLWENLTSAMKRVGELVGVQESFIIRCLRGTNKNNNNQNKLNIHKRFYTALALQDLVNEVPLSEVAGKFQCARGFLQGLQQASATFAELLELMKLSSLNGVRARTLFNAGFETIASIASAEVNVIENALHKSVPFQSEKQRDEDDLNDLRKRNKIKNIWITGYCGMTAQEAAEKLIIEARNYLVQEIGVTEIKWKDTRSEKDILGKNEIDLQQNNIEPNTNGDVETNGKDIIDTENKSIFEPENLKLLDKKMNKELSIINSSKRENGENDSINENNILYKQELGLNHRNIGYNGSIKSNKETETQGNINNNDLKIVEEISQSDQKITTNNSVTSGSTKCLKIGQNKKECELKINEVNINNLNSSPGSKDEMEWVSLNLTGIVLDNMSKLNSDNIIPIDTSDKVNELKHNESTASDVALTKSGSSKDVSLFSSDGDDSSLFEDSFPADLPSTIIDKLNNDSSVNPKNGVVNPNSTANAFSSIFDIDEDEDIKLVYEDEKKCSEDNDINISQNEIIIDTQDMNETIIKHHFISPRKRRANTDKTSAKRSKLQRKLYSNRSVEEMQIKNKTTRSEEFLLNINNTKITCKVSRDEDIVMSLLHINKAKRASIILDMNSTSKTNCNIGNKIFENEIELHKYELPFKGIAFCLRDDSCFYIDLIDMGENEQIFKKKMIEILSNDSLQLDMLSIKTYYVEIKKYFGVNLSYCNDVSLAEWLLDSEEKISTIADLTFKYCDLDLQKMEIKIDDQMKSYKSLNMYEMSCLRAWCLRNIVKQQEKKISQETLAMEKILNTEIQVCKILGDCEYHGITVDKDLVSRFLIDVKNSQEILQKKAFKICGYHFNFNSSKDVAKVLGLYKGRKISTRKSVLSAHNSPMSSIIIYWRKLNSILTKSLYPITEQACVYTEDNRISPSYTMYTCTGRVSMHEPNLQNLPRKFTIPSNYLCDNESCGDVIEFNCRKIFKAAPGYVFISADYCQLEMRILTHFSKDVTLTRIMGSDVDVFKSIAASWSGVPENEVDDDLRHKAKQLCYGILYGMGNRTLSQHLNVTELEAAYFMDMFYKTYPSIKVFTASLIEECRKKGYVETLMKRRRYLPHINSSVPAKRSAAERQAVNTTIQGSAADIAKSAMCSIQQASSSRLILQMHDELIYEVPIINKQDFIITLKKSMENTVRLNVPLPVKIKCGQTWGTMEDIK